MIENPRLPFLREKTANLTSSPGVYLMKNDRAEIIYIGKAKHLKNRVSSYFRAAAEHPPKVAHMVSQVYDYDFIVTDSEYESLVLECSLIKQHQPKYNILLKDDKGYCYLCFSQEHYPRLTAERNKTKLGDYLGPYMSGFVARETAAEVNRVFRLPTCRKKFPQEFHKTRPCLNFYIQQCIGVCRGTISEYEYAAIIQKAKEYIQSGSIDAVKQMRAEMEDAVERLDFEKAAVLRDRITAVTKAGEKQKILDVPFPEADVIALADNGEMQCISLLCYRQNRLFDKKAFFFTESVSREELLTSFLTQFYGQHQNFIPSQILLEFPIPNQDMIQQFLAEISDTKVHLFVPQRGEKTKYVQLAVQNALEEIALRCNQKGREVRALEELGNLLSLSKPPRIIESYDVSNLSSDGIVCGMVVFVQGKPQKKLYRQFQIRDRTKPDDCACIAEALTRRFRAYTEGEDAAFSQLPDLILLDGGKAQVHAGKSVLVQFPYEIPLYGMVKDSKHRTRAIATDGGEISLSSTSPAFQLLSQIQEEVHRYSISWMRRAHEKSSYTSILTNVRGIGEKKAQKLLLFYRTLEKMRDAPVTELAKVAGISNKTAKNLHQLLLEISAETNEKN